MAITAVQQHLDFAENMIFDVIPGDLENIKKQLPLLYSTQAEDVSMIEQCLWIRNRKAYLITNGTGTGKTFVGLGVVSRFFAKGLRNILVVVPTDKKCKDWIEEGALFSLTVRQLESTQDSYGNIVVTTYANFYQNDMLMLRDFDLVIYDECHYLNQNAKGDKTTYFETHCKVAKLPNYSNELARGQMGPYPNYDNFKETEEGRQIWRQMVEQYDADFDKLAKAIHNSTKVLYLSATPFAYHKNLKYMDGTLWNFSQFPGNHKADSNYGRYNQPNDGFESFLCDKLGYRMSHNKLTIPETGVDQGMLERKLFEDSVKEGIMSTRQLFLKHDYSREFIRVESEIGYRIDEGIKMLNSHEFSKDFPLLSKYAKNHFNYLFINQILEMIKVRAVIPRIRKHIDLNRKVVIYHSYNEGYISHPFKFDADKMLVTAESKMMLLDKLWKEIQLFSERYPEYWNMDLEDLKNVRETIKEHFPENSVQFNGKVAKGKRAKNAESFMKDYSSTDIIVVQVKAGKEGISFHDTTGEQQRVLMTLGLPTAPTDAIQIEGRIYREGVKSNAVYEYITLQTSFEATAFADKIATRSKTAENLAMGNLARDLETAFREGYHSYNENDPNEHQGFGGVEDDKDVQEGSEFEKACTFYYMNMKRKTTRNQRVGVDYYATPEPLGFKMVEWLGLEPGDKFLEPSAGHGAIARFASPLTDNKFVEASYELASKLAINVTGDVIRSRFEDYYIGNKFKGIAMNPPFGRAGSLAAEHVMKAANHLEPFGKLLAIVPAGKSFVEKWNKMKSEIIVGSQLHVTGMIRLPACTFERAGTKVVTNIWRIVRVPRHFDFEMNKEDIPVIDLTWCNNVEMLFSAIEDLNFSNTTENNS